MSKHFVTIQELNPHFLILSVQTLEEEREIIFVTLLENDAIETIVLQSSSRLSRVEHSIVGIISMDRLVGGNVKSCAFSLQFPITLCIPFVAVKLRIFEISVLNKFGIKSTISTIVDVLLLVTLVVLSLLSSIRVSLAWMMVQTQWRSQLLLTAQFRG